MGYKKIILSISIIACYVSLCNAQGEHIFFKHVNYEDHQKTRNPKLALPLAVACTVVPSLIGITLFNTGGDGVGLILAGVGLGPSAGNIYLGNYTDAAIGALARITGGIFLYGGMFAQVLISWGSGKRHQNPFYGIGTAAILTGIAYDWVTTIIYSKRYHERNEPPPFEIRPSFDTRTNVPLLSMKLRL